MDPVATFALVSDETLTLDERAEVALDLLCWLARDGFWNGPVSRSRAVSRCETVIIAQQESPVAVMA